MATRQVSNPTLFPAKVKKCILDGYEVDENNSMSADSWGGPNAVGLIFYKKIRVKSKGAVKNIDQYEKEEITQFDGRALPLFPF